jgi:hypothetical protein
MSAGMTARRRQSPRGWAATVANDEDGKTPSMAGIADDDITQQGDDP